MEDYLTLRRDACGGKSTLALIEFGLDLPEEVMQHATVQSLTRVAVELIIVVNVRVFTFLLSITILTNLTGHAFVCQGGIMRSWGAQSRFRHDEGIWDQSSVRLQQVR